MEKRDDRGGFSLEIFQQLAVKQGRRRGESKAENED